MNQLVVSDCSELTGFWNLNIFGYISSEMHLNDPGNLRVC